jgi:hypothetical protein
MAGILGGALAEVLKCYEGSSGSWSPGCSDEMLDLVKGNWQQKKENKGVWASLENRGSKAAMVLSRCVFCVLPLHCYS